MLVVDTQPLTDIVQELRRRIAAGETPIELRVAAPDRARGCYPGERIGMGGREVVYRPLRVWLDLAERLQLRLLTPRAIDEDWLELVFERLDPDADPLDSRHGTALSKYGPTSSFSRISKLEDPSFVLDMADAVERVGLSPGARVLVLGVNTGDEVALLTALAPELAPSLQLVGIDRDVAALDVARHRFAGSGYRFVQADINDLPDTALPRFDLVLSIATLHSPGVHDRTILRHLVQERLTPTGALILGFPNCRYLDGEPLFGARMRNFRQPELSLVIKELAFYRRYLHQHHRKVFITGKYELLLTAVSVR